MAHRVLIGLLFVLMLDFGQAARADDTQQKEALATEIIEYTHAADLANQLGQVMLTQLLPVFSQANPGKEAEVDAILGQELHAEFDAAKPELEALMVEIFATEYTQSELEAIRNFYRSEAGQALIAKQQHVMQTSMALGQRWGEKVAERAVSKAVERLRAKGLKTPT